MMKCYIVAKGLTLFKPTFRSEVFQVLIKDHYTQTCHIQTRLPSSHYRLIKIQFQICENFTVSVKTEKGRVHCPSQYRPGLDESELALFSVFTDRIKVSQI